jgi:Amt family ammonium transporter
VFGTLCVGLFADPTVAPSAAVAKRGLLLGGGMAQLGPQLLGIGLVGAVVFALSLAFWYVTKAISGGIRVSAEEEMEGLDIGEHGNRAYPDFQTGAALVHEASEAERAGARIGTTPVPAGGR